MTFFSNDNVHMTLHTTADTYIPGDTIEGTLRVEVLRDLELTAVRMTVRATERASMWVRTRRNGKDGQLNQLSRTATEERVHFEEAITFFGSTKTSGRTGGASLQVGSYEYPFRVPIPPAVPPTFDFRYDDDDRSGSSLSYVVKACVDVPDGFDAEVEKPIVVLPCVPLTQFESARTKRVELQASSQVHGCACCGAFCCTEDGEHINVQASLGNSMAVLSGTTARAAPLGMPPPQAVAADGHQSPAASNTVQLRLTIANRMRKAAVRSFVVTLSQFVMLNVDGFSSSNTRVIATTKRSLSTQELLPGATLTMDVELVLPDDFSVGNHRQGGKLLPTPTLRTPFTDCSCVLSIAFPGVTAEPVVWKSGAVCLTAAVDRANAVPEAPALYTNCLILPEKLWGSDV